MACRTWLVAIVGASALAALTGLHTARSSCTNPECSETSCFKKLMSCTEYDLTTAGEIFSTSGGDDLEDATGTVKPRVATCEDQCPAANFTSDHGGTGCMGTSAWGSPVQKKHCVDNS